MKTELVVAAVMVLVMSSSNALLVNRLKKAHKEEYDWNSLIQSILLDSGDIDFAGIIRHDGEVRAKSDGFELKEGEGLEIVSILENPPNESDFYFKVGGLFYKLTEVGNFSIYGLGTNGSGIVLEMAKDSILIAHHTRSQSASGAKSAVKFLGKWMRENA